MKFKVTLRRTVVFEKIVVVEARNDLVASDKAENQVFPGDFDKVISDDIEAYDCEEMEDS